MLSWNEWKIRYKHEIAHIVGFEEMFVDRILSKISSITPQDVIPQYHFVDEKGINRYIDFMIINESKGYCLPIELDGLSKMLGDNQEYQKFNDFLERQNSIVAKFGKVLRFSNKKMLNESNLVVEQIYHELSKQSDLKKYGSSMQVKVGSGGEFGMKITLIIGAAVVCILCVWFLVGKFSEQQKVNHQMLAINQKDIKSNSKMVCGLVAQIKGFSRGSYLNIGHAYPNQDITIVVWDVSVEDAAHLEREKVCASGVLKEYKGKPQLSVDSLRDIDVK